jgi:hypothetical protein
MNNEQIELLDDAYNDYCSSFSDSIIEPNIKELFIDKCKHNIEYSIRWGLKIEEQTIFEQVDQNNPVLKGSTALYPRKLITVTYKDKTCLNVN